MYDEQGGLQCKRCQVKDANHDPLWELPERGAAEKWSTQSFEKHQNYPFRLRSLSEMASSAAIKTWNFKMSLRAEALVKAWMFRSYFYRITPEHQNKHQTDCFLPEFTKLILSANSLTLACWLYHLPEHTLVLFLSATALAGGWENYRILNFSKQGWK